MQFIDYLLFKKQEAQKNRKKKQLQEKNETVTPSVSFAEWVNMYPNPEKHKQKLGKGWAKGPIPLPEGFKGDIKEYPSGFGGAKGMFVMSPDFDEPLEDFKEYMY